MIYCLLKLKQYLGSKVGTYLCAYKPTYLPISLELNTHFYKTGATIVQYFTTFVLKEPTKYIGTYCSKMWGFLKASHQWVQWLVNFADKHIISNQIDVPII